MKTEMEENYKWEREESRKDERECHESLGKERACQMFPRTRADYEMLYAMVENWQKAEIKRISHMKSDVSKRTEFCLLLKKEIESLNAIERYRMELKKEKLAKKELSIMEKVHKAGMSISSWLSSAVVHLHKLTHNTTTIITTTTIKNVDNDNNNHF
jgi:hypothetical protein